MMIVDAQVHIWKNDTPERPWPPGHAGLEHRKEPWGTEELLGAMDEAGVTRTVLVPPSWEGDRNDYALEAAQQHPDRLAVMGRLSLTDPASKTAFSTLVKQPGMLGLRFTFHTPASRAWLTDGTADWLWSAAEAAGVPLMILTPGSLPVVDGIAERHPGLKLVIDHMALTRHRSVEENFSHMPDLVRLARRANVGVKVSCLPDYASGQYPYPVVHPYIRAAYDAYGPSRLFWGSDLSRLPCTYRQGVTMFTEELSFLSETDKAEIMGLAICKWLGWSIKTEATR